MLHILTSISSLFKSGLVLDHGFLNNPLGHNTLDNMMATICKKAGVTGFKTNHSLRATAASRLYHSGIDEQLIMERVGHCSIEGIRSYKQTNNQQQLQVSNLLNAAGCTRYQSSHIYIIIRVDFAARAKTYCIFWDSVTQMLTSDNYSK